MTSSCDKAISALYSSGNRESTSGYATWLTAGDAIRITHYDVIDDVITRKLKDGEKRRPPRPMKSSELSNGENRIALRQLLQNRKLPHL